MSERTSPIGIPWRLTLLPHLMEAPEPPPCPDYGLPAYPRRGRNQCAEPWIAIYDVPCTDEAVSCLLFRKRHYAWRQSRLLALLHRRPTPTDSPLTKYNWCVEVLERLVELADDTNLQHAFLSRHGTPDFFERTRSVLRAMRPTHGGTALPLMFPELWRTGAGDENVPRAQSAIGYHVLSHFDDIDTVRGAYLRMPDGRTASLLLEHVRAAHAAVMPRPVPTAWPATALAAGEAPRSAATQWIARARAAGRNVEPRELTLALFDAAPRPGAFLRGSVERATGSAPCLAGPAARECFHYEWMPVAIAGAEWTMDLLAAHAEDWLQAPFDAVLNAGFQRYLTYLQPFAERGVLGLSPAELRAHHERAARTEAQAWVTTAVGTTAAIAAALGPVGQVAGLIIAVIGAVVALLVEVLPLATGDGDCPVLGFRRTIPDGDCATPEPQGNPQFAASIRRYRDVAMTGRADGGTGTGEEDDSVGSGEDGGKGPDLWLWGLGAAAVGAALLVGVAAYRKSQRQSAPSVARPRPRAPQRDQDDDEDDDENLELDEDLEPDDEPEEPR